MPTYITYTLQARDASIQQQHQKKPHPYTQKIHRYKDQLRQKMNLAMVQRGFNPNIDYFSLHTSNQEIIQARAAVMQSLKKEYEHLERLQKKPVQMLHALTEKTTKLYQDLSSTSKKVAESTNHYNQKKSIFAVKEKDYQKAQSALNRAKKDYENNEKLLTSIERHQAHLSADEKAIDLQEQHYENRMIKCDQRIQKLERDICELRSGTKQLGIIDKLLGITVQEKIAHKEKQIQYNKDLSQTTLAVYNQEKPNLDQQRLELQPKKNLVSEALSKAKTLHQASEETYNDLKKRCKAPQQEYEDAKKELHAAKKILSDAKNTHANTKQQAAAQFKALNTHVKKYDLHQRFSIDTKTHSIKSQQISTPRSTTVDRIAAESQSSQQAHTQERRSLRQQNNQIKNTTSSMLAAHSAERLRIRDVYQREKATLSKPDPLQTEKVIHKIMGQ